MNPDQAALKAGQLVQDLSQGYYTHAAALQIATDPRAPLLAPPIRPGHQVPTADVHRKDGTAHTFHFLHYLEQASGHQVISSELERVWFIGSILRVGDVLGQNRYFDRAPELELLRHMRNGIAHGNRFRLDSAAQLQNFPAHNKLAWVRSDTKTAFEITMALNDSGVLFEFMAPGDILDLLMSISLYLIRMGNGDQLRP